MSDDGKKKDLVENSAGSYPATIEDDSSDYALPALLDGVRDDKKKIKTQIEASKKALRVTTVMLEKTTRQLYAEQDEMDDMATNILRVDMLDKIVDVLGKVNRKYMELNYLPTGEFSVKDLLLAKRGQRNPSTGTPAGGVVATILDTGENGLEVNPSDVLEGKKK